MLRKLETLFVVVLFAVPLIVTGYAVRADAQSRAAGEFDPALTVAPVLYFVDNPDGGATSCVTSRGIVRTDAGLSWEVRADVVCPRNATQANRVEACNDIAVRLVNASRGWVDGGL